MQNSSDFQYIAIDQITESPTNPRKTFDLHKLEELASSIRENDVIQPVVVRPKGNAFELVVGARRYRASLLAEKFSIPARVKELTDAQVIEWQLLENSQRVDVHPYQEAQGYQQLLEMPGYDVGALAAKAGKSASHIYSRLSLLQLIPSVAEAFETDRITVSHANLIARLPAEHQQSAFDNCWRKDWKDNNEPHLLPAKNLTAWIQTNLYLNLADAPFDRSDSTLVPEAGACLTCPKRSGYNTSLFADVEGDQCLNAVCFQTKVNVSIERKIEARPELIQIETSFASPKEHRPGALKRNEYEPLDTPDNPDAEAPCPHTRSAIVVFGRQLGHIVSVCTEPDDCPVHNPEMQSDGEDREEEEPISPPPSMPEAPPEETEEEAAERIAEHERQVADYQQRETERQQAQEQREQEQQRQREEREAERQRREELRQARRATFASILSRVPVAFDAKQLRFVLRMLIECVSYGSLEEVAAMLTDEGEDSGMSDDYIVSLHLDATEDAGLTGFALRIVLSEYLDVPREEQVDWLAEAEKVFPPAVGATTAKKKTVAKAKASTHGRAKVTKGEKKKAA